MLIYRTVFGSVVYGTNVPSSDTDYKSVFLPNKKDLYLSRASKIQTNNTKKNSLEKNTSADIDDESYSLHYYLTLLADGQTPMIDMLFAPSKFHSQDSPIWSEVLKNKEQLLSKNVLPVIGYCKTQAAKYGIKGSRMGACKKIVDYLAGFEVQSITLNEAQIIKWVEEQKDEFIKIVIVDEKEKGMRPYLEVVNRKCALNNTIKYALSIYQKIYDTYGHRAKMAEENEGVDWKALYHAVRVAKEGEELLLTGNITFPRPEAPLLLTIRKGELPYKQVAELVEEGLENVEKASLKSSLPAKPNYKWIEDFVYSTYLEVLK